MAAAVLFTSSSPSSVTADPLLSLLRSPPSCSVYFPASSSCSKEASTSLPQHHHTGTSSFDWSDFPIVGRDSCFNDSHHPYSYSTTSYSYPYETTPFSSSSIVDPAISDESSQSPSTTSEPTNARSEAAAPSQPVVPTTLPSAAVLPAAPTASDSSNSALQGRRRRSSNPAVTFSPFVQVQTVSLALGDHPCCTGGMALSCDWPVLHTAMIDLDSYEKQSLKRRQGSLRLSYVQRRHRLVECTGLSPSELLQQEYRQQDEACTSSTLASSGWGASSSSRPRPLHVIPSVQRELVFF